MFTFLSRFRRQTAVLTALALVASVLVAVPVSAADDPPKPSYGATFTACLDISDAGFTDVPESHANAGDIDCIAYYTITRGTSATTYSPLMSVTREQMALFLKRLAEVVGIEVVSDPADPGFTDIGDLSDESQEAIALLRELEITRGNNASGTTYGPGDPVTRGQMALFVARLMNAMAPISNGGTDNEPDWGYTPNDVKANKAVDENDDDAHIGTPFGDLDRVTKETYDAITNLYELGVAVGISDTAYNPSASIRRDHMAGFMAAVLDHSNARPEGLTIQATGIESFGSYEPTIVVSYRTELFQPVADTSIAMFHGVSEFQDDGTCPTGSDCDWSDDEYLTEASGNNSDYEAGEVSAGGENTYYAWIGDEETTKFDVDNGLHKSITLTAAHDATRIKVTSDINPNSTNDAEHSDKATETVNLDRDSSVTYTVQLIDAGGDPVHKKDVEITVMLTEAPGDGTDGVSDADFTTTPSYSASAQEVLKTDSKGQATFTTRSGPKSTGSGAGNDDAERYDRITFSAGDLDGNTTRNEANTNPGQPGEQVVKQIVWTDAASVLSHAKAEADKFVIRGPDGKVRVRASVTYYDQYGNPAAKGQTVTITIGGESPAPERTVTTSGRASHTRTYEASADIAVEIGSLTVDGVTVSGPTVASVRLVVPANSGAVTDDDGETVVAVYDGNRFLLTVSDTANLYTYDADDIFVIDGKQRSGSDGVAAFEKAIKATDDSDVLNASVQIVVYNTKGSSIFRVR